MARSSTPQNTSQLRSLPSVDELLSHPQLTNLAGSSGRSLVVDTIRNVLAGVRAECAPNGQPGAAVPPVEELASRVTAAVQARLAPSLRPVINATGVILHTNLGRAPLSGQAVSAMAESAGRYSNLEYDVSSGQRGQRDVHTSQLVAELAGAESAIVVNNNAAAVFLVLNTLARNAEVVVSRGELIEIGGGFRIPEIMSESGTQLCEVGTTNRTRIYDYQQALNERTRLLLRVHPSNFRITGFTERASLPELVALGNHVGLPVYEDLGSGCLVDLSANGIDEPLVRASCACGVSVVSFSGDKLLGGPQAGIIAGKKEIVDRIRRNPLFRALRVGKMVVAALEVTLQSYRRGAFDEIPALRMIRASGNEIKIRAGRLVAALQLQLAVNATFEIREGFSVIGGGATPDRQLPTHLISIASDRHSAAALEKALRRPVAGFPVIARIEEDRVVIDLRTVSAEEEDALAAALAAALS